MFGRGSLTPMRRKFSVLFLGLALAWALGAGRGDAFGADGEPTTIRFCYWANFSDDELMRQIVEGFERENPDVRISREWYVSDYGRKLQLTLITNTAPEIILMDDELYPAYSIRGYLEDLRPYINRKSDDLERALAEDLRRYLDPPEGRRGPPAQRHTLPTSLESFNYRGFQGALPWDGNVVLMFYNKDLFDQEGVPYPTKDWTWNDFREIAKKLTKDLNGDGINDQFGANFSFIFTDFETPLWCFGGEVLNKDYTKCLLNGPRAREAAQFIYDMKYKDRSMAWSGQLEGFYTEVQLLTGRIAMVPAGSYMIATLNQIPDAMRWDVAHIPIGPHGDRHTRLTWDGISINANAPPQMKEIAWRFIKYMLSDESQIAIGSRQHGMPIWPDLAAQSYVSPETPAHEEVALEATQYGKLTPITPRYLEIRDAMTTEFDRLNIAEITGITPTEALNGIVQKVDRVLAKELADWSEDLKNELPHEQANARSGLESLAVALGIVAAGFGALFLIPAFRAGFRRRLQEMRAMVRGKMARIEALEGVLFASPWLLGLCLFTAFPIVFSVVLSLSDWDPYQPISTMKFIGLGNFARAFSSNPVTGDWENVRIALYNTFFFAFFAVPIGLTASLGLALLLNQKVRGITIFRTTFYLPSIVAGVATVILWMYIFNPIFGPLNTFLRGVNNVLAHIPVLMYLHLPEPMWLGDPHWTKPAMILMTLWGAGGAGMLIFLAGLQGVPDQLYEVAELDGASRFRQFLSITLPMLTPTIYFNFIMGLIGAMKVFMQAYIMTNGTGGVDKSLLFYVLHLYKKAFQEYEMGYASALAWILFVIILGFTLLIIKSSAVWVYYEGEKER